VKIGIIGPGALGCLFAAKLFLTASEQNEIMLIDHNPDRAAMLNEQGIFFESDGIKQNLAIPISGRLEEIGHIDVLFSCVKSHDLEQSLSFAAPLLTDSTLLIFLQNGIGHLAFEKREDISAIPVFATSSEGATLLAPGHTKHAGKGRTYLGFLSQQPQTHEKYLLQLTNILQKADIDCRIPNDILSRLWAKLFVNVGINALTAIHNLPNGQLLASSAILDRMKQLVKEAERVALASEISIKENPVDTTIRVCQQTAQNISSMLQDVRKHRVTEIDSINGMISRLGREKDVATPLNDAIITQVKNIEKKYHEHTAQ
jgi:2-dehydropantoate 2-reductase